MRVRADNAKAVFLTHQAKGLPRNGLARNGLAADNVQQNANVNRQAEYTHESLYLLSCKVFSTYKS